MADQVMHALFFHFPILVLTSENRQHRAVRIVTGAGNGIGPAIIHKLLLLTKVSHIVAVDLNTQKLELLQGDYPKQLHIVRGHVSQESTNIKAVDMAIQHGGRLTTLILNAATFKPMEPFQTLNLDGWKRAFDINFSSIVHMHCCPKGGVIAVARNENGKAIQDQDFQETGFLNQPPSILRAAVNGLMAQYEGKGHQLEASINAILRRNRDYGENTVGPNQAPIDYISLECFTRQMTSPAVPQLWPERTEDEDDPSIHYGLIASANRLMKDATIRDTLAAKDVLCFEMEAAGLMNHFPCLVIRGICDYSDTHKNKEWQGYAAMTAAAYAKDLLCRLPPNRIEAEKKISEVISGLKSEVSAISRKASTIIHHQRTQEHRHILEWLTPVNYGPQQSDYFGRRQPGTGQWLLESAKFQGWLENKQQTLFCPGMPGVGKTILSSTVVESLKAQNNGSVGIVYLYCNFQRQDEQTAKDLLASLLKQLTQHLPTFPERVKSLYHKHKHELARPSLEEVTSTLQSIATLYARVFILINTLDECRATDGSRTRLLAEVFKLQAKSAANHLLEIRATDEDVWRYLDSYMSRLPGFVPYSPKLQEEVQSGIVHSVGGMFLLAELHLESLVGKITIKAVRSALANLSSGSDAYDCAYKTAIERIEKQVPDHRSLIKQILSWITWAKRPLTTKELRHALAVKVGMTGLDEDSLLEIEDIIAQEVIDFLESDAKVDSSSQALMAEKHWWVHEYSQEVPREVTGLHLVAYFGVENSIQALLSRNNLDCMDSYGRTALSYAAEKGHKAIVELLLDTGKVNADAQNRWGLTPLFWATKQGHEAIVKLLLDTRKVNVNIKDWGGQSPLLWAAHGGQKGIVKLLLETGKVDLYARGQSGQASLLRAAEQGHDAIVKLLLDTGKLTSMTKIRVVEHRSRGPPRRDAAT
ncbi:hypothetical protein BKA56DRAFT_622398 [Ilyonectria sp. MPI-CAGE-AT-0026]|nr:hypothetical protein BKA56DRAFT_622398 [Ilyonectria sp. MPI-CAGE-AT-0026]